MCSISKPKNRTVAAPTPAINPVLMGIPRRISHALKVIVSIMVKIRIMVRALPSKPSIILATKLIVNH